MLDSKYVTHDDLRDFPQAVWLKQFLIGHPGIIAGGCFRSVFTGEKPHDLDMFFHDVGEYSQAVQYFRAAKDKYLPGYQNKNVESFIHLESKTRIECVKTIFGTPEEILDQFDFTIAKFAICIEPEPPDSPYDDWTYNELITYHPFFFEHLSMKRLVVDDKMPFPVSTFNRCFKYAARGFFPCRETKLKILRAINELPNVEDGDLSKAMYEGHD